GWCADVCGTGVALRVTSSWPSSRTRKQAVPGAPSTWWTNTPNCSPTVTRRSARSGAFRSRSTRTGACTWRSEEHTSELQSRFDLVCRLLLEKKQLHIWTQLDDEWERVHGHRAELVRGDVRASDQASPGLGGVEPRDPVAGAPAERQRGRLAG